MRCYQLAIKNKSLLADFGLVFVTIIWGSGFVVVKNTTDSISPCYIIAIRFALAAVLMSIIFFKKLKNINKSYIKSGLLLGTLLFFAFYFQTIGVQYTTAGNNAFLTAGYVIVVPFLYWIVKNQKPDANNIIAAFLCITGIGLLSLNSDFTMGLGDILSLLCCVFFASHIIAIDILTKKNDPILLSFLQFLFTAVIAFIVALFTETYPTNLSIDTISSILYIGVFCTLIAQALQVVCQKYTHPSKASLIMSLESVFGSIFGIIFLNEPITIKILGGSILIFLSIIISETKLSLFKFSKKVKALKD
jgi:drug/metabolite transporter (DMT)-like permease